MMMWTIVQFPTNKHRNHRDHRFGQQHHQKSPHPWTTVQIEVCSTAAAGDFAEQFQMSVESSKLKWWKFHIFHPFCGFSSHFSTSQHVCVSWVVVRGKVITFRRIVNRFRLDSVATSAAEKRGKHLSSYSARITQRHTF